MRASVILPTKDRGKLIEQTINSLLDLDLAPHEFEILLIDNCSKPANQADLKAIAAQHPDRLRYIYEPKLGLNNARNCGINQSKAEILVFLDDDAVVPTYWLTHILKYFDQDPQVYALGGKVIAQFTTPAPDWIDQRLGLYISNFDRGDQPQKLFYNEYPRGANMAFRRQAFAQFGYFRDCFDRKGKSLMSYGDIEMCYRIDQGGYTVLYVPDAEVLHLIRGDRLNPKWFAQRFYWQGRSEGLFELLHYGRAKVWQGIRDHWQKSWQGDPYDQRFHRGYLVAIALNFWRRQFL